MHHMLADFSLWILDASKLIVIKFLGGGFHFRLMGPFLPVLYKYLPTLLDQDTWYFCYKDVNHASRKLFLWFQIDYVTGMILIIVSQIC